MNAQDRIALDGAFKNFARAQLEIDRLVDEGISKTMAHVDRNEWALYFGRLEVARAAADVAHNELEALYRTLMPN